MSNTPFASYNEMTAEQAFKLANQRYHVTLQKIYEGIKESALTVDGGYKYTVLKTEMPEGEHVYNKIIEQGYIVSTYVINSDYWVIDYSDPVPPTT